MRRASFVFLIAGFALGYGVVFTWTRQHAPDIVRATARAPQEQSAASASRPPLDTERVGRLQERIRENPTDFDALVELASIHFDQQNFSEADDLYTKALEIRPEDVNLRTERAAVYFYTGRFDEAIAEFRTALSTHPTHPQALFNLGVTLLYGKNDPQGAIESWERLIDTNPNYPQIAFVREQLQAIREQVNP